MEKIYHLDESDIAKATFSVREVCDRQHSNEPLEKVLKEGYFTGFSRTDMFWVRVEIDGEDIGSCCINPDLFDHDQFSISKNWCEADHESFKKLKPRIEEFFRQSPQFQQQKMWLRQIKEKFFDPAGGYPAWCAKSREAQEVEKQRKIAIVQKYADQFQRFVCGDESVKENLKQSLKSDNECFEHMLWVYENWVPKS